jgi:hypothetical protein
MTRRRRAPHPLPRSALPRPLRMTITPAMLEAYKAMRRAEARCKCSPYGGPRCEGCQDYDAAEAALRGLFQLESWQEVVAETLDPDARPWQRAAFFRYVNLEDALREARQLARAIP